MWLKWNINIDYYFQCEFPSFFQCIVYIHLKYSKHITLFAFRIQPYSTYVTVIFVHGGKITNTKWQNIKRRNLMVMTINKTLGIL